MSDRLPLPKAVPSAEGALVAILDDNADLRLTLAGFLAENGFRPLALPDGPSFLALGPRPSTRANGSRPNTALPPRPPGP